MASSCSTDAAEGPGRLTDPDLVDDVAPGIVGRRRQIELVVAGLAAGRHILLEGPPGTGKSTLLAAVAATAGVGFVAVEGNLELTPARLIGHHDPSRVLSEGYNDAGFVDGPLVSAMRLGSLLYVEELNRVPEETLNVLVTVMSEGWLHVPRLGRVTAAEGFRLVAAMNPFDSVGTARISSALYDRTCRVAMGYQTAEEESAIVQRQVARSEHGAPSGPVDRTWIARVVDVVRLTRDHPDIRMGSSVRGAIDLVLVAGRLSIIRRTAVGDGDVGIDAALAALSGRIRLFEGSPRTPEEVITDLWHQVFERDASSPANAANATNAGAPRSLSDPAPPTEKATAPSGLPPQGA